MAISKSQEIEQFKKELEPLIHEANKTKSRTDLQIKRNPNGNLAKTLAGHFFNHVSSAASKIEVFKATVGEDQYINFLNEKIGEKTINQTMDEWLNSDIWKSLGTEDQKQKLESIRAATFSSNSMPSESSEQQFMAAVRSADSLDSLTTAITRYSGKINSSQGEIDKDLLVKSLKVMFNNPEIRKNCAIGNKYDISSITRSFGIRDAFDKIATEQYNKDIFEMNVRSANSLDSLVSAINAYPGKINSSQGEVDKELLVNSLKNLFNTPDFKENVVRGDIQAISSITRSSGIRDALSRIIHKEYNEEMKQSFNQKPVNASPVSLIDQMIQEVKEQIIDKKRNLGITKADNPTESLESFIKVLDDLKESSSSDDKKMEKFYSGVGELEAKGSEKAKHTINAVLNNNQKYLDMKEKFPPTSPAQAKTDSVDENAELKHPTLTSLEQQTKLSLMEKYQRYSTTTKKEKNISWLRNIHKQSGKLMFGSKREEHIDRLVKAINESKESNLPPEDRAVKIYQVIANIEKSLSKEHNLYESGLKRLVT